MSDEAHADMSGEAFRATAVAATAAHFCAIDSGTTWRDLIEGRTTIVDEFSAHGWSFLVVRCSTEKTERRLTPRTLEILEEVLLGSDPKVVSIDRRLSASTIATCLKQACEAIGIRCKPSKVPLLLVALVHAAKGEGRLDSGRAAEFDYRGGRYRVLCVPSPYSVFDRFLSPAEKAVMRMRLEGKSHAEIAERRRTSRRTVANQVATAFHRLGVSCRSDLMELLIVSDEVLVRSAPPEAQSAPAAFADPATQFMTLCHESNERSQDSAEI
ncbi:MAG TPA: LuxR C-terminal-related transcriptional regulator [Polyangiaceae bacterium]|nr:LuxR C-terminal-related transcriptional regulator [Polyangiaceae bacterium]